jgi:hypothetical protein
MVPEISAVDDAVGDSTPLSKAALGGTKSFSSGAHPDKNTNVRNVVMSRMYL